MPNLSNPLNVQQVLRGAAAPMDVYENSTLIEKPEPKHWQYKAFQYYDDVPEVRFAANFIANTMSRLRLVAAEIPEDPKDPPKPTDNKAIKNAINNFKNSRSGQSGLLKRYGQHLFLAGETYVCGETDPDGEQDWEVYSPLELRVIGTYGSSNAKYEIVMEEGGTPRPVPENTTVFRVWNEHPAYYFEPDSALRGLSSQCEKLITLENQDVSVARSKFAGSGILTVPSELLSIGISDVDEEQDAAEDPLIVSIQEAMIQPIIGTLQPEDVVPMIISGASDYLKEIRHITLEKSINAFSDEQKLSTIRRMATAMDLPNEVLLGMGGTNHWTAWKIYEETFQAHLRPFAELICNSITIAYLHPALAAADVEDYKKYIVWYDDSDLVSKPDKSQNAIKAHERLVLSDEALLREMNLDPNDLPDEEELVRRSTLLMRDSQYLIDKGLISDPSADAGPRKSHDAKVAYQEDKSRASADTPGAAKSPLPGTNEGEKEVARKGNITASAFSEHTKGYVEATIERALEKAGAKVRTMIPKNSEASRLIDQYPNNKIISQLDDGMLEQYGIKLDSILDFSSATSYIADKENMSEEQANEFLLGETKARLRN